MDQNSSATLKYGARARNGAAKAAGAEARTAQGRPAKARNALTKIRPGKTVVNGHATAA